LVLSCDVAWAPSAPGAEVARSVAAADAADASICFLRSASLACRSTFRISSSNASLKSVEALRNSAISLPNPRANSGSLCGPNTTSTTINSTTNRGTLNMLSNDPFRIHWHHRNGAHRCQTALYELAFQLHAI